jgi:hypothetical protein
MLLVFMNSSAAVWDALHRAIKDAGFYIIKADVFDKQHGTFKHFVSENTSGADLVLHCLKPTRSDSIEPVGSPAMAAQDFVRTVNPGAYVNAYLHVRRPTDLDLRRLYSEWVAQAVVGGIELMDFGRFRTVALEALGSSASG